MVLPVGESQPWDFSAVYSLLHTLSAGDDLAPSHTGTPLLLDFPLESEHSPRLPAAKQFEERPQALGNFDRVWEFLGLPLDAPAPEIKGPPSPETLYQIKKFAPIIKGVKWRDELDGFDLESNVEPPRLTRLERRRAKKAERKLRRKAARQLDDAITAPQVPASDFTTDASSEDELRKLRRSPNRRTVTQNVLLESSPPTSTSPSPPKDSRPPRIPTRKPPTPITALFDWKASALLSGVSTAIYIRPIKSLTSTERRRLLVKQLMKSCAEERHLLATPSLADPSFSLFNVSPIGIHVFVDISNILIGFHDALKDSRGLPRTSRVKRIPFSFYNLSLVLERGRPASKRVLAGSDPVATLVAEAKAVGYETNILSRVHKIKELTTRQKRYASASSGSDTASKRAASEKWVEQGVDEVLHLKMLESIIDAPRPSTIVLATGDAAEAEYSGGFMKMVERALERGWAVEVVSFAYNTSYAYKKKEFREKWKGRFKLVGLDPYLESLFGAE